MDKEGDNSISRGISANCSNPGPETLAPDVKNLAGIFLNGSYYYPAFGKKVERYITTRISILKSTGISHIISQI